MSVLLVEDNPERISKFRRACIGVSLTNLTTARMAIQWLEDHTPQLIFLDYDLHEYGLDRAESGCGGDVVTWMTGCSKRWAKTTVVIHSLNIAGAERMFQKLSRKDIVSTKIPHIWQRESDVALLLRGIL